MEELAKTPYTREFVLVCVDPVLGRPPLPSWLKTVPSLLVAGEDAPRVGPGPVNNWLFERRQGSGPTTRTAANALEERRAPLTPPVYSPDMAPRPDATARMGGGARAGALPPAISSATKADSSMGPPTLSMSEEGPMGFHFGEMGGGRLSDTYSFLGAPAFESDKGFNPIMKNFESLNSTAMGGAGAGGMGGAGRPAPKVTEKESKLLREFEAFAASRDRDIPGPVRRQ